MNILLVSGPGISLKEPYNSGIEAFLVSLADELVKAGHRVDIVAGEADEPRSFGLVNPFWSSRHDNPGLFRRMLEVFQFKRLPFGSYDIIHYHMFYPHLLEAGVHFGKPTMITLHSPADEKRVAVYKKLSARRNVRLVAISDRMKVQWEQGLGFRIDAIYNGINLESWSCRTKADTKYLLWSARINTHKNPAAAIALARHLNVPLRIAGRIVDAAYFEAQVRPYLDSEIQYVGHLNQQELNRLSAQAIAYLATATWQEPFGLAALEMLASGVPVVAFPTAVPPYWKNNSVLTASSTDWRDLIPLVEACRTVTPEGCRAFAENMSVVRMTKEYVQAYESAIKENN